MHNLWELKMCIHLETKIKELEAKINEQEHSCQETEP